MLKIRLLDEYEKQASRSTSIRRYNPRLMMLNDELKTNAL